SNSSCILSKISLRLKAVNSLRSLDTSSAYLTSYMIPSIHWQLLARQSFIGFQVFFPSLGHHVCGRRRRRAVLVPAGRLQPIADELLVEGGRACAGPVLVPGPEAAAVRGEDFVDQDQLPTGQLAPFELGIGDNNASALGILSRL